MSEVRQTALTGSEINGSPPQNQTHERLLSQRKSKEQQYMNLPNFEEEDDRKSKKVGFQIEKGDVSQMTADLKESLKPFDDWKEVLAYEVQPEYLNKTFKKKMRWLMLALSCSFVIGNYYCYDNPSSLEVQMESKLDITPTQYGFLYTAYAIPNCILPLVGGLLFDKIGTRNGLILFTIILTAGQGIFTWGGYQNSYNIMIVGRVVFGIGCESMYVGQSAIVSSWFINYELPLAISMISCIPLLGSQLNGIVTPRVYAETQDFGFTFSIGFYFCLANFVLVCFIYCLDRAADKKDEIILKDYIEAQTQQNGSEAQRATTFKQGVDIDEKFEWSDLKTLELPFWLTCLSCFCTYVAIINQIVIGSSYLQTRFNYDETQAGNIFSLPYLIAAVASPILGIYVEKFGQRMTIILTGSLIMLTAHVIALITPDCDYQESNCIASLIPLILLGLSYTSYAVVLWGSLPYMVEARLLGTAFGVCTTFQNLGTVIAPPVLGWIVEGTKELSYGQGGYFWTSVFFIIISFMAFIFNIMVYMYDKKKRANLLQTTSPLENFERYTQTRMTSQRSSQR